MGRNRMGISITQTVDTFQLYLDRLTEIALSMFKWENLPDTVDARYIEMVLMFQGKAVFFKDEDLGFLCLKCAANGPYNVYDVPINRRAYASNSYQKTMTQNDSVIIYNNMVRKPSFIDLRSFAIRLSQIERTIDVNLKAQKTPVLISATEQQRATMLALYQQYDGDEPFIFGDKNLTNNVSVLKTDAPYIIDRLNEHKTIVWNEALTYLGIPNVAVSKKERLITDEVIRGQGGTIASRFSRLNARQQAADEINRMFGLNIKVNLQPELNSSITEQANTGEVEENVNLYNPG